MSMPAPQRPAGGDFVAFARTHKGPMVAGGLGLVALLAIYERNKAANASTASTTSSSTTPAYDSSYTDLANQIQDELNTLQGEIDTYAGGGGPQPPVTNKPGGGKPPPPKPLPKPAPKPKPKPKPTSKGTPAKGQYYTVQSGNNLSEIAARYGTNWQSIYAANRGTIGGNPNLIHPGQRLLIPRKG